MSLNQILLIGNAGRDAQLRYTQNGTAVTNFSMAVSRRYQLRDETREDTEWFNVSAWERQAEWVAETVKRGTRVFVDGRLSTREYTSGNGETRVSLDVNARRVVALTPGPGNGENGGSNHDNPLQAQNGRNSSEYALAGAGKEASAASDQSDDLENIPW